MIKRSYLANFLTSSAAFVGLALLVTVVVYRFIEDHTIDLLFSLPPVIVAVFPMFIGAVAPSRRKFWEQTCGIALLIPAIQAVLFLTNPVWTIISAQLFAGVLLLSSGLIRPPSMVITQSNQVDRHIAIVLAISALILPVIKVSVDKDLVSFVWSLIPLVICWLPLLSVMKARALPIGLADYLLKIALFIGLTSVMFYQLSGVFILIALMLFASHCLNHLPISAMKKA